MSAVHDLSCRPSVMSASALCQTVSAWMLVLLQGKPNLLRSCWRKTSRVHPFLETDPDQSFVDLQSTLSIEPPPLSRTPEPQDPAASQPSRPLPPLPPTTPKALSVSAAAPAPAASEATSVPQLVTGGSLRVAQICITRNNQCWRHLPDKMTGASFAACFMKTATDTTPSWSARWCMACTGICLDNSSGTSSAS